MPVTDFALCTLSQVKQALALSDISLVRDNYLIELINDASADIERFCRRQFVARDYSEFYDGMGSSSLYLQHYPILNIATLLDDTDRKYNSSAFVIKKNSRLIEPEEGIVRLWNERGIFQDGKQNVKVEYHAGYANLDVQWGSQKFDFREGASSTIYTVQIPPDEYNVFSLATRIKTSMSSLGLNTYNVSYDTKNRKYSISLSTGQTNTLQLLFNSSTTVAEPLPPVLGFATAANLTGATKYTPATTANPRIPREIERACIDTVITRYDLSPYGRNQRNVKSERIGQYQVTYIGSGVAPDYVKTVLKQYQRQLIG